MINLNNKVVLVVGSLTSLEIVLVKELLENEASVIIVSNESREIADKKLEKFNSLIQYYQCNSLVEKEVKKLYLNIIDKYGKLDAAINNAFLLKNFNIKLENYSVLEWSNVIDLHLKSIWINMKHQITEMLKNPSGGSIVNVSTVGGVVGLKGLSPYSAAHHGLIGLTKNAASEMGKKPVRINTICSNLFITEDSIMDKDVEKLNDHILKNTPMRRIVEKEEIAKSAIWLCSSESTYITGTSILVDGGYTAI